MNAIFKRVSVRKFKETPVEKEKIIKILKAAMAAPSACNRQPWEFFAITDKAVINELSKARSSAAYAVDSPAVIVPCYKSKDMKFSEFDHLDLGAATENILLEIAELGLGGVWLSVAPIRERMDAIKRVLKLEDLEPFAVIAFGYADEEKQQQDRFDEGKIHWI